MKALRKILFFISLTAIYFIVKEFISLYVLLIDFYKPLGIVFIILSSAFIIYFAVIPVYQIYRMEKFEGPTSDKKKINELRAKRIERFRTNPYLLESEEINAPLLENNEEDYELAVEILTRKAEEIRRKRVNAIFYSTGISQNGFIDGLFMLGGSFSLIKEIFVLYNGRINNLSMFAIVRKIYYAVLIAGTDGVEYASNEIFGKIGTHTLKSIPFLSGIITSVVDGFVNASLLTRIAITTENYCKVLYAENEKELVPNAKFVVDTAKKITQEATSTIKANMIKLTDGKAGEKVKNPINYVFGKAQTAWTSGAEKVKGIIPKKSKDILE